MTQLKLKTYNNKKQIPHSRPLLDQSDLHAVNTIMSSEQLAQGSTVDEFESLCGKFLGHSFTTTTPSGTDALILALLSLNVSNGDEVILPSYICPSVLGAVLRVGATPVLSDISKFWLIDIQSVKPLITKKTKAIIINHTFGLKLDVTPFVDLKIPIIEDCCQAFSHGYGTIGDVSVYSFHATKCLTTGQGGMLASSNEQIINEISKFRRENASTPRLSDLQAALGKSQLEKYGAMLSKRQLIAQRYVSELPDFLTDRITGSVPSIFFRFPIWIDKAFLLIQKEYETFGICVRNGVDELLHRKLGLEDNFFPNTIEAYEHTLSLPIYPALEDDDIDRIILATKSIFK